jgi:uncharacterized protein YecE (DUF72 family)
MFKEAQLKRALGAADAGGDAGWWRHDKSEDRYDYLYSKDELEPFVDIANAVRALVKKMYLYTNNHFAAKSVANALMLKDGVNLPISGMYPEGIPRAVSRSGEDRPLATEPTAASIPKASSRRS